MARRKSKKPVNNTDFTALLAVSLEIKTETAPQGAVEEVGIETLDLEAILQEGEEELEKMLLAAEEEEAAALYARLRDVRKAGMKAAELTGGCPVKMEVEVSRLQGRVKGLEAEQTALLEKRRLREKELAHLVVRLKKGERAALVPAKEKQALIARVGRRLGDLEEATQATHRLLQEAVIKLEKRRGAPAAVRSFAVEEGHLEKALSNMIVEGIKTGGRMAPTLERLREEARAWAARKK